MQLSNRRRFLSLALGAGGVLGLGMGAWRWRDAASPPPANDSTGPFAAQRLQAVNRKSWALGTRVSLTVLHEGRATAQQALTAALAELRVVEGVMSLYRPDSQLCRLNRRGVLDHPHQYLVAVLRESAEMSQRSAGAFDVTVQPLWTVYADAARAGEHPGPAAIAAARQKVDWRQVEVSPARIRLHRRGAAVTLNGIAQGFAADRVMSVLRQHGVDHALVDTGEIGTLGGKAAGQAWTVGIQHPRRADAFIQTAGLEGRCLATSGDYATAFSSDHRHHHVFDPRTGRSPTVLASVSIAATTATAADALSTAVFVLGPEEGLRLVRATPAADALLVFKNGTRFATQGFSTPT